MRPGWQTSGSQLEAMVRGSATPESSVLDLGRGRGGGGGGILRGSETFPVQYRANTVGGLRRLAAASGLDVTELRVVADPTYLAVNGFMFTTSVFAERLMPKGWGVHLLGDLTKR